MARRFLLSNFLLIVVAFAAWNGGLLVWLNSLPHTGWLMIYFLLLVWTAGLVFAALRLHSEVFHIANLLPMLGLLCTITGVQLSADGIREMTPDAAFTMFIGIIRAMPMTAISLVLMMWLRDVQFWCSREHV